ncbi:family 20 glycosylhydrolase [Motilimonas cestriensis]|uniref:beta-N-acetylhexosaminidase n=1 Tax=Motilimonas cestriensis TaxID=2742685 RepID=A0ABS8W4X5_9GAMM|nr:family 20 glycosylhydrolase [Motilimonas cestriensis]MCE2594024.1 family 20 glycosylhydrolase [Motilimonas cestriensis]
MSLAVFPQPKYWQPQAGVFALPSQWPEQALNCSSLFPSWVEETLNVALSPQQFEISISPTQVKVRYGCTQGRLYALYVLKQLCQHDSDLPCGQIIDAPDYPERGILLDISRDKIPSLTHLFSLIDLWSELRINQLQLYTEHTFAWSQHQTVWADKSPMTADEIQQVDQYCQSKGIELIINVATFGHMERWLAHPEYKHLAEQTTGFYDQRGDFRPFSFGLNPVSDESVNFVSGLIDELVPNFTSQTININFDETMDLGVSASKAACEATSKGQVYVDYLNKILKLTRAKGLHTQIFSDMLFQYPDILAQLPSNLTLLNWGYEADHPYDEEHQQLAKTGLPFHVVVSTCCFASVSGRWQNAKTHMLRAAKSGLRFGATGYQISEWGDMGHAQQDIFPYAGYIYGAGLAWNIEQNEQADITFWLNHFVCQGDEQAAFWALRLQDIYLDLGIDTPNACFLGPLLFDQKFRRHLRRSENLTDAGFDRAQDQITPCLEELSQGATTAIREQLIFTAKLLHHGVLLGKQMLQQNTRAIEEFDSASKQLLAADLAPLLPQYKALWLATNRAGGLADSVGRLEYLHGLYTQST